MRSEVLVGVHAEQLVVVLGGHDDLAAVAERVSDSFGEGPVVTGPVVDGLGQAGESAAVALAGLRAVRAWPAAPRPVAADALLAERALDGDPLARTALETTVVRPLRAAGSEVLETVRAVLGSGGNLEASARALFVHPNTVRYRLKRAMEITGLSATDPRGSWTLQVALALADLDRSRSLWH
jgi:DNA-binding PucR family transcriptional regulator